MKLNLHYHPGMRTIKTVLAVFITLLIGYLFKQTSVFYGSIAAVICIQKSGKETFKKGIQRLLGTIIGGIFGYICLEIFVHFEFYYDFLYIICGPLGLFILLCFMNMINKQDEIVVGCVVYLGIVVNFNRAFTDIPIYVVDRVVETMLGVFVAMILNVNYHKLIHKLYHKEDGTC